MDTRNKKRVGNREILPFVLTAPLLREFVRSMAAFNEDTHSFGTEHVEALVRPRLQPAEVSFVPEFRHAALQGFVRSAGEGRQMVERRNAKLIDVVHDLFVPLGELEAGAWHDGA